MNRLTAALLASATVVALAACSDDSSNSNLNGNGNGNGNGSSAVNTTVSPTAAVASAVKVSPQEGQALMQSLGAELTIIDVRTPDEFAISHIEGAVNIDLEGGGFSAAIAGLDPTKPYIVYCHSGRRAALAAETMVAAGFTGVRDMGGIADWQAAGLPIVTG
jgi:phage shock protein E